MNILQEICDRRLSDIAEKGFGYGHEIPEKRTRPVVPFLAEPGTILEIKRASPSKGDIAPDLDSVETAGNYIAAGTSAISVLTEENYFKGTLDDLKAVADYVHANGNKVAVLRKDFLLEPEEIEVAYRCGADAVLLIARILETDKLLKMAAKAFSKGLSILLELRDEEAVVKAFEVLKMAKKMHSEDKVVLGINARDLKTFTIDMLIPLKIKCRIEKKFMELPEEERPSQIRVITESGVLCPESAEFSRSLGFHGILIGEAVARDPENAKRYVSAFLGGKKTISSGFWKKISEKLNANEDEANGKPLVKICGITNSEDAVCAVSFGADVLGFILEEKFPRHCQLDNIPLVRHSLERYIASSEKEMPLLVGVITDTESREYKTAVTLLELGVLDGIQYHGCAEDITRGYKAVRLGNAEQIEEVKESLKKGCPRVLVDACVEGVAGGSGKQISPELVQKASECGKLWLAGGLNEENVSGVVKSFGPELIDVSSGLEYIAGVKDHVKIENLFTALS